MADSNTIAMQGGVPAFDFYRPMLVAAQMRQQQMMEDRQRFDMTKQRLGQVATELMATPQDQKANVWQANADRLVKEGWMTPQQYAQYGSYSPLLEQRLLASALEPAQFIAYQQQQQDRATGREVLGKITGMIGGDQAGATPAAPGATPATPATPALVAPVGNGTPTSPGPGGVVWPPTKSALPAPALPPLDSSLSPASPKDIQDRLPALPPTAADSLPGVGAKPVSYLSAMPSASGPAASFGTGPITPAQSAAAMNESGALPPEAPAAPVMPSTAAMPPAVRPTAIAAPRSPLVTPGSLPESGGASVIGGMPSRQMVPFLAVAAGLPGVPEATQKVATELLKHSLQESAATPDQKEYWNTYYPQEIAAGRKPMDFTPWYRENKAAGRQQVTIDQKGESAFSVKSNQAIATRYEKIIEEGDTAQTDLGFIGQLRALNGQFKTGGTAGLQGWLAERGVKVGSNISAIEAYSSLINRLTPTQRPPGAGATSDFDAAMYKASLPRLLNTPGGNAFIIDVMQAVAQDRVDRAKIADMGQTGELTIKETNEKLRSLGKNMQELNKKIENFGKADSGAGGITIPPPPEGSVPLEIIK